MTLQPSWSSWCVPSFGRLLRLIVHRKLSVAASKTMAQQEATIVRKTAARNTIAGEALRFKLLWQARFFSLPEVAKRERIFEGEWSESLGIDSKSLLGNDHRRHIIGLNDGDLSAQWLLSGRLLFAVPNQIHSKPVEINLGDADIDFLTEAFNQLKNWISGSVLIVLLLEVRIHDCFHLN